MRNKYFDELVTENDLFYVCFMIEKTSRFLHQRNQYVVNQLGEYSTHSEPHRPALRATRSIM